MGVPFGFAIFLLDVFLLTAIVKRGFWQNAQKKPGVKTAIFWLAAKVGFLFAALGLSLSVFALHPVELVLGAMLALLVSALWITRATFFLKE